MNQTRFGPVDQIGYLVEDLDSSIERWIERFGVGPWTVFRNVRMDGRYLGQPTTVEMDVALAYLGEVQIELIRVTNHARSPYRDVHGRPILGMHHIAWVVDDIDASIARMTSLGLRLVFEARNPSTRVAYFDDAREPGVLFEVIQGEAMRSMIAAGIAAARAWDGTHPLTSIDAAALAAGATQPSSPQE